MKTATNSLLYATPETNTVDLDHKMPREYNRAGMNSACTNLRDEGKLHIVGGNQIVKNMGEIKDPSLSMGDFRRISGYLLRQVVGTTRADAPENNKIGISWRAGDAFLPFVLDMFPDSEVGFMWQKRNEDTLVAENDSRKWGDFTGKHAILFDPMLATGGSMCDMVEAAMDEGATGVTTVSIFSTPQGVLRVAKNPSVQKLITTPLETGLNINGFIVGGNQPYSMVGDFGDRFFGPVK